MENENVKKKKKSSVSLGTIRCCEWDGNLKRKKKEKDKRKNEWTFMIIRNKLSVVKGDE